MALLSSPLCKCLQIKTGPRMAEVRTGVTSSFECDRKQSEMPPSHCLSLDGFKIKTAELFTTSRALMRARALDSKRGAAGRVQGVKTSASLCAIPEGSRQLEPKRDGGHRVQKDSARQGAELGEAACQSLKVTQAARR